MANRASRLELAETGRLHVALDFELAALRGDIRKRCCELPGQG